MIPSTRLLLFLVTIGGSTSFGASADGPALTEAQYVERVLSKGLAARALEAEAEAERAESAGVGTWPNPSLGWERESVQAGGLAQRQDKLTASIPLVLSGRLGLEREASGLRRSAADARLEQARAALHRRAIDAFATARAAQLRARILAESRTELRALTEVVAARERAGTAAGYERLRIELESAAVEVLAEDAALAERSAEAAALALLSPDARTLPPFEGELAPDRRLPEPSALAAELEARRADLRALQFEHEAAERASRAAARRWIPDPIVGGGALLVEDAADRGLGFTVDLTVPLPLFEHGQGDRARALAARSLSEVRRSLALHEALTELQVAVGEARSRRGQLERHRSEVLPRARSLREAATAAYRAGGADLLVLVDAERTLREAQLRELELSLGVTRAEADLLLLSGRLELPVHEDRQR